MYTFRIYKLQSGSLQVLIMKDGIPQADRLIYKQGESGPKFRQRCVEYCKSREAMESK